MAVPSTAHNAMPWAVPLIEPLAMTTQSSPTGAKPLMSDDINPGVKSCRTRLPWGVPSVMHTSMP